VLSGLIYNFLPFMALPLYVALERLDPSLLDAATDLYSSRLQAFLRVTLPLSLPGVFAGSLLTFIPAVGDFINADLLGGVNTVMIGNVIQREFVTNLDYPEGAALSFLLMGMIVIGVFLYARALGTEELTG
jgi:spermidine/putrescine transport system permease protein